MASINVGKTTAFLDDIFQAISSGKKVSEELIEEARKYKFNSAVQMAEAHNKGEKISATAAATEKALSKKNKVAETGELKAKESAAIAAQNKAKQDARNQYLMDKVKKGKSADIAAEMDKKLQENPDTFIAGLVQDINKLNAVEKAAAEKTKQPKLVKDLTEKGGSPVSAKTAEAPAPAATPAPIKEASPTAKLDEQIEDVQDKLAEASEGDAPALNKKLQALIKQRESAVKKAPTPAAETKPAPAPAPTPAAPAAVATPTTPTATPKPPVVIRRKEDKTTPAATEPPPPAVTPEAKPESKSLENIKTVAKADVTPTAVATKEEPPVQFKKTETGEAVSAEQATTLQKDYEAAVKTNTVPQFNKKIKALGFTLAAAGAAGTVLGPGEKAEQKPAEDTLIKVRPHLTTGEFEQYKKLFDERAAVTTELERQQTKLEDAQSKITPNYYTNYNKQAADAKRRISELNAQLSSTTQNLSSLEKNIPKEVLSPPVKKMQEKAQISGDFKTTPTPQADEKSRQITELQRQINDPSKTPEQKKILQSALDRMQGKTPGAEPAPGPAPTPSVTPPAEPTAPFAPAPKGKGPFTTDNPTQLVNFFKQVQESASSMSQLDKSTQERLTGLEQNLSNKIADATKLYEETVQKARTDADRREAMLTWASIGEQLGQAVTKYFAAREGKRLGARIGSQLKFEKHDWAGDLDRSLKKMESELAGAKEKYGIVSKEVEAGREALGKERTRLEDRAVKQADTFIKAALDANERKQLEQSRAAMKAEDRAFEQAQNAAKLNNAVRVQEMRLEQSRAALQSRFSEAQRKEADAVKNARSEAAGIFNSWYAAKGAKKGQEGDKFAKAAKNLQLTTQEAQELGRLAGRPGWFAEEENKAAAAAILQQAEIRRLNNMSGGQVNITGAEEGEAPAVQTSGQEPTFSVIFEGYENDPKIMTEAQFKAAQAKYGTRVKKVGAQ